MNARHSGRRFSCRLGIVSLLLGLASFGPEKTASGALLPGTPLPGNPGFILEFDEAGHARIITGAGAVDEVGVLQKDGGILYALPVPVSPGDVIVTNPLDITKDNPSGNSDLLTFFGSSLLYRSLLDEVEPNPDPADVKGLIFPDTAFSTVESGPEGNNSFVWLLDSGLPSYTVYNGISDAPVPEPSTFILAALGLFALLLLGRRRRDRMTKCLA